MSLSKPEVSHLCLHAPSTLHVRKNIVLLIYMTSTQETGVCFPWKTIINSDFSPDKDGLFFVFFFSASSCIDVNKAQET